MASDSTVTSPRSTAADKGICRLLVVFGPREQAAKASKVLETPLVLSREARAESNEQARFVLEDPEVSRHHATLFRGEDNAWQLRDEGSHNGTFVNGLRIEKCPLPPGDVLRVGQHVLIMQFLDLDASKRLSRRRPADSAFVGASPPCQALDEQLATYAKQTAHVLVCGESGTGKELVARQLHTLGGRTGPYITVNCTTLSESVADSELFGHVKGAFSGATETTKGLFADAAGGTLLLDEIGDMSLALQAKLLRVLETGEVRPVGSSRSHTVDTRVVAATHVDLGEAVTEGRFRGDLLARLQRLVITVPPLRARREDVPLLVRHFLRANGSRLSVSTDAIEALMVHDWPYNVRELRNAVESAVLRAKQGGGSNLLELKDLPPALWQRFTPRLDDAPPSRLVGLLPPASADELMSALKRHNWNITRVADAFSKDRKQVYRWCERFGIDPSGPH